MSFKFFQQLPPELRVKVWEESLPGPRMFGQIIAINSLRRSYWGAHAFRTLPEAEKAPAALFVNFELRQIALKRFTRASDDVLHDRCIRQIYQPKHAQVNSPQYVDYDKDFATITWRSTRSFRRLASSIRPVEWDKLTELVITDCPVKYTVDTSNLEWVLGFSCLKELTIDCSSRDPRLDWWDCICEEETLVLESGQKVIIIGVDDAVQRYIKVMRIVIERLKEGASGRWGYRRE